MSQNFRWWFITYNNPQGDWKKILDDFSASYALGQLEKGSEGTPHIQALLYFVTSRRPSSFQGIPCWAKGISASDAKLRVHNYCSKEETRLDGPYSYGTKPAGLAKGRDFDSALTFAKEGRFSEIQASIYIPYLQSLKKIYNDSQKPLTRSNVCGVWIYGPPGCGKTHYAHEKYGEDLYVKPQNKWFDGYLTHRNILLDDLDKLGSALGHLLKLWLDKWPCSGETKGGTIPLLHERFVITSNYLPDDLWPEDSILVSAIKRRCRFVFIPSRNSIIEASEYGQYPNQSLNITSMLLNH